MALFWSDTITLQRSRPPLDLRTSTLVLYPRNPKQTLGQYRGRGPGPERVTKVGQPKAVLTLLEIPKGVELADGQ